MIRYLLAQTAPFPIGPGGGGVDTVVSQQTAKTATDALAGAKGAGEAASKTLSSIWDLTTKTDGLWWLMLYDAIKPLLLLGFVAWVGVAVYDNATKGGIGIKKERFLAPILVAVLLFNNGLLLSFSLQVAHLIPKSINDRILETSIQGISGKARIQQGLNQALYNSTLNDATKACGSIQDSDAKKVCLDSAQKQAEDLANKENPSGSNLPKGNSIGEVFGAVFTGKLALEGFRLSIQAAIIGILTTAAYASHLVFGLLQAIWGMFALFFCGMHLIPGAPDLRFYFSGFLGISIAILFNSAWQVLSALLLATAADWDPLLFPLFTGFIGPFAAALIGFMGFQGAIALVGSSLRGGASILRIGR